MSIDIKQLEINVNLHALQPDFLNSELHYIIAQTENSFRFAAWNEEPGEHEEKFYGFLEEKELLIPAGNILLKQSYVLSKEPPFPLISNYLDFIAVIDTLSANIPSKRIRRFYNEDIDILKEGLEKKYGKVEKHVVTSRQGQHLLLVINEIEISISATMVYFRYKTIFNENHYRHVKEED